MEDAPTQTEAQQEIQTELERLPAVGGRHRDRTRFRDEIARSKQLINEAKQATKKLMHDIRLGKRMDLKQVDMIVDRMTDSVLNDKDALVSLLRIKNVDEYTYLHSMAVSALCISFAQGLGFDSVQVKQIGKSLRIESWLWLRSC